MKDIFDENEEKRSWQYHDGQALFDLWFSVAAQNLLSSAIEEMSKLKVCQADSETQIKDPPTLLISGRKETHPSAKSPLAGCSKKEKFINVEFVGKLDIIKQHVQINK